MGTRECDKGAHEDCIATWGCRDVSKSRLTVSACLSSGEGVGDAVSQCSEQRVQMITAMKRSWRERDVDRL